MGMVDGRGYKDQQKDAICDACGPCQKIRSTFKPVFLLILTDWLWLRVAHDQVPKCPDLVIFMMITQTD